MTFVPGEELSIVACGGQSDRDRSIMQENVFCVYLNSVSVSIRTPFPGRFQGPLRFSSHNEALPSRSTIRRMRL